MFFPFASINSKALIIISGYLQRNVSPQIQNELRTVKDHT